LVIEPGSLPAGYPLDGLAPQRVMVEKSAPGRATFVLRPYRSVTGRVRLFDRGTGNYVGLARTPVELRQLQRLCVTDANGVFVFRDLRVTGFSWITHRIGAG